MSQKALPNAGNNVVGQMRGHSDHNDSHFNGICVVLIEQVKRVLHEGASPVALAAAMIGVGSYLMRQSTSTDFTLRLLNGVAMELARISVTEAASGRNSVNQTMPVTREIGHGNPASASTNNWNIPTTR